MRYFCPKLPEQASGWRQKQSVELPGPRLECQCWGSYRGNTLAIACAEGPVLTRVDAQSLTRQKEAQTASGIEPREGHVLFQHSDLSSVLFVSCLPESRVGSQNQVIEAKRLKNITCMMHKRILTSWQRSSQRTRLLRSTAKFLKGSQRDNRVVTLTLLVLTHSVHGYELRIYELVKPCKTTTSALDAHSIDTLERSTSRE